MNKSKSTDLIHGHIAKSIFWFSVWSPFDVQQPGEIVKQSGVNWLEHHPLPVVVSLRFVIDPLNFLGIAASLPLKLCALIFSQDDHKSDAVFSCVQGAQRLSAPAVFVFIGPCLAALIPEAVHIILLFDQSA